MDLGLAAGERTPGGGVNDSAHGVALDGCRRAPFMGQEWTQPSKHADGPLHVHYCIVQPPPLCRLFHIPVLHMHMQQMVACRQLAVLQVN